MALPNTTLYQSWVHSLISSKIFIKFMYITVPFNSALYVVKYVGPQYKDV